MPLAARKHARGMCVCVHIYSLSELECVSDKECVTTTQIQSGGTLGMSVHISLGATVYTWQSTISDILLP